MSKFFTNLFALLFIPILFVCVLRLSANGGEYKPIDFRRFYNYAVDGFKDEQTNLKTDFSTLKTYVDKLDWNWKEYEDGDGYITNFLMNIWGYIKNVGSILYIVYWFFTSVIRYVIMLSWYIIRLVYYGITMIVPVS